MTSVFIDTGKAVFASSDELAKRLDIARTEMLMLRSRPDFPERNDIETIGDVEDHAEQIRTWTHKTPSNNHCAECRKPFTVHEWLHREGLLSSDADGIDVHEECA